MAAAKSTAPNCQNPILPSPPVTQTPILCTQYVVRTQYAESVLSHYATPAPPQPPPGASGANLCRLRFLSVSRPLSVVVLARRYNHPLSHTNPRFLFSHFHYSLPYIFGRAIHPTRLIWSCCLVLCLSVALFFGRYGYPVSVRVRCAPIRGCRIWRGRERP